PWRACFGRSSTTAVGIRSGATRDRPPRSQSTSCERRSVTRRDTKRVVPPSGKALNYDTPRSPFSGNGRRIDLEAPAYGPWTELLELRTPAREELLQGASLRGLDEYLPAFHSGASSERSRDRRVDFAGAALRACHRPRPLGRARQKRVDRGALSRLRPKQRQVPEGRQAQAAAFGEKRAGEVVVVVTHKRDEQRVLQEVGLHQHFAAQRAATGATGDLLEQRE